MWPELPIEFNVTGTPVSSQSNNGAAKLEWKNTVLSAAQVVIGEGSWSFGETRLAVTMYYFSASPMTGDIDNIVKLTLDALQPNVYVDDSLVDRVLVQRFDPDGGYTFRSPGKVLAAAIEAEDSMLYVKLFEAPLEDISS